MTDLSTSRKLLQEQQQASCQRNASREFRGLPDPPVSGS